MNADKTMYILRLIFEWIIVVLAAAAMVCDIVEPGSTNGFAWAAISLVSGVRCILCVHQNRILEESRDAWKGLAERASGILDEYVQKNMQRLERSQSDKNDLK